MKDIWDRIDGWLEANAPEIFGDLLSGATEEEIWSVEEQIGAKFTDDVRASYMVHNGQLGMADPLMGEWQLLSLKDLQIQWSMMKHLFDEEQFANVQSKPTTSSVKADWWNPRWVPLSYNGAGDFYCLDMEPAIDGNVGQIISFWHMDEKREKVAASFQEWLENYANALENGNYLVQDGELILSEDDCS